MLARCPNCGLVFPSAFPSLAGANTIMYVRNSRETCPRCGAYAATDDGVIEVRRRVLSIVSHRSQERINYSLVKRLHDQVRAEEITLEKATEKLSPEAAFTLKDWLNITPLWISVIIMAAGLVLSQCQPTMTQGEVEAIADKAIAEAFLVAERQQPNKPKGYIGQHEPTDHPGIENRTARRAAEAKKRKKEKTKR